MDKITDYFGSMVFDDRVMKATLPDKVYASLKKTIDEGTALDEKVANVVAQAMKDWAVNLGATHFTHWFQPLTGITAEKHDSFIAPAPDGRAIMEFSGKELIKGEPDASSFPSGGIRATFEARGYTAWDPTSYAFIKDGVLCIPTAFCSYSGEALDKKTPLLRSMEALSEQAVRILKLFGNDSVKCVRTSVGPEQEYFLVDRAMYEQRDDLKYTGRTLFGALPPKGQEMDDHYFGAIKPRVAKFMAELNRELWKLGIFAKTEHNEVAPAQHELATIYRSTNIAADNNQVTMEIMQKVALKHDLVCLLQEKPFDGVNGSGKHNNWSLATDKGVNLLTPGDTPYENAQFLLFLSAVIKAVDKYQELLRISVATAGNDHRLGANEAPPAVISIFLGDELEAVIDAIDKDEPYEGTDHTAMMLGVKALPKFLKDTTDRNRTSPFAFTGNKFEFRMLGSSNSISCCNIMLNGAVAEVLKGFADELEKADDFEKSLRELVKRTIKEHKRIIFNGNGYDDSWIDEAVNVRGLKNLKTTPDAYKVFLTEKNISMLTGLKIFTKKELESRHDIMLENYVKTVNIEALTMVHMAKQQILPAVESYASDLARDLSARKAAVPEIEGKSDKNTIAALSAYADALDEEAETLKAASDEYKSIDDIVKAADFVQYEMIPRMEKLRKTADAAEVITAEKYWPFPDYGKLLYGVR